MIGVEIMNIKKTKMSKYRNIKTKVDGILFDSKKEAARYCELKILLKKKKIYNLVCHPVFPIIISDVKVCKYIADFSYTEILPNHNKYDVVEDVKGVRTAIYRLKKKLVKAMYGIDIKEV